MTAEIAIMNKEAVALASDSAVTMGGETGQKIFTSANKLFTLSKYHPVGIMVYGSAIFMGVPWETIIKIYRNNFGKEKFNTLKEYANGFIEFLDNGNPLFPDSVQEDYLRSSIYSYFNFIKDKITKEVHSVVEEKGKATDEEIKQIVSKIIKEHYEKWEKADNIPSIPENFNKDIIDKYKEIIEKTIEEVFERLPISKNHSNQLKKIAGSLFSKFPENIQTTDTSGVVIAGFGEKDTFPSLDSFHLEGIVNNKVKYKEHISQKIDFKTIASITPFAQREMVATFMEGIDPYLQNNMEGYLSEIFDKYPEIIVENIEKFNDNEKRLLKGKLKKVSNKIFKDYQKHVQTYRRENYVNPVTSVVSMLPKDELAAMAESLVNLTCFKRKVTMESETVGGPIDVAVISKGDGFIWIKRKHYFKPELNSQFFTNYYKEV
jgi:histone H3/H4